MADERKDMPLEAEESKVGVYICYCGGNISDHVDVEQVRERLEKTPGVAIARTNMFMCSDPGQELIMEDLRAGRVNRVVVASCSPSLHEGTFRAAIARAGGNPYQYEHANIREQVSWVHHGQGATDKATLLVAAASAKAELLEALAPLRVEAKRHAVVVGGGVAGMRAALCLAESGVTVVLVERERHLGGAAARLGRLAPSGGDAAELVRELAGQVLCHAGVTVHVAAEVTSFSGFMGNFKLGIGPVPGQNTPTVGPGAYARGLGVAAAALTVPLALETGVVVLATGHASYTPRQGEYGFGEGPEVVTLPEFVRALAEQDGASGGRLSYGGRAIRRLALVHCVGSRQIPGVHQEDEHGHLNEHCSRVCCSASINAANTVRERFPQTAVYELYRDIRTYGRGQEEMYAKASANGVVFLRFADEDTPEVARAPQGSDFPLQVTVRDQLTLGEELQVPVDLVVLATGMEPASIPGLTELLKLPVGADRFLQEVHPKLRPVELPMSGLFLAGTCQAPMDIGESCNAAAAAAVKAAALLSKGFVELDPFVAEVNAATCTGCGECVAACLSEGALALAGTDGRNVAHVTPALCLGCGACVAVCPESAINVNGATLAQYEAMVDRILDDGICAAKAD